MRRCRSSCTVNRPRGWLALLFLALALVPQIASASQLRLSWVDNSGGVASFRIQRKTGTAGTYAQLALGGPGLTSYTDTTVVAGTTYCYRVQAYTAAGVSAYSNEACRTSGLALTVSLTGTGKGTVSSSPAGISCGTDCTQIYPSGTVVTLSAAASSGSTFGGWSKGGCAGTGTCTLTDNTSVTVVATFTQAP
jgi:hypothetical protein